MRQVLIQEFSLSVAVEYRHSVAFSEARLDDVAKALVSSPCAEFLKADEITLSKQNGLFSYALSVPMFGGSASIIVNAQGVTVSFKKGTIKDHLDLMIRLALTALETAKAGEVKRSLSSFALHAVFVPPSDYAEHMKRFTELAPTVVSGGLIVVTQIPEIEGELRYASEKSLGYSNALFFAANAVSTKDVTADLFKILGNQFERAAALDGITFKLN